MKHFITLLIAIPFFLTSQAQCDAAIPAGAVVFDQSSGFGNYAVQDVWICASSQLAAAGDMNTFYLEPGGGISFTGDNNTVYAKNAFVFISSGATDNTVYHEGSAALISDSGTNTNVISCVSITFDHSNAPANGCANVGIAEQGLASQIILFPAPVVDRLNIRIEGNIAIEQVRVLDALGREVLVFSMLDVAAIDLNSLVTGTYFVHLVTDQGSVVRTINKL